METQQIALIRAALEAKRQDEEALALYWALIQANADPELLPEAYLLLYTVWQAQHHEESLTGLVDAACQSRFADVDVLSLIAEGEFEASRYANALKLYDRLLTLQSLSERGFQCLKLACFQHQPFDEFVNLLLQHCLAESPDDVSLLQYLFSQYVQHEKYTYSSSALAIYQRILQHDPANSTARSVLCEGYFRQGKYEEALTEGEVGLQQDEPSLDILATLAKVHYELGEYGRVVSYCRDVLTKRPGRMDSQVLLATVYAKNALTTNDAIKHYQRALQGDSENLLVRQALFRAYLRKLQLEDAIKECQRLVATLHERYGTSDREFRLWIKDMITEYERVIRRMPGDITLYFITAKLYEYIGHFNKALIYYRMMLQLPLERPTIHRLIDLLERLATFQVQNPHLYLYLGLLYHKIDRYDEAKLAFRLAMYSELDEREVDDILVRHDRSIWRYPPVLVILAHHRIVTKDILEGLIQVFQGTDREDWNGVLWVLQELYDIDDLLVELRQVFGWEAFDEIYREIIPIFANNGSGYAIQVLKDLLSHPNEDVRFEAFKALIQMNHPLAEQSLAEASKDSPYADIRLELAAYYAQQATEQSTYHLLNMLHDAEVEVRLYVVRALQHREVPSESLREILFTEQHAEVKLEIVKLFERSHHPAESIYLTHLLNDLLAKRYEDQSASKVYTRLKKLISQVEKPDEIRLISTLIQAVGNMRLEQSIHSLSMVATTDHSQLLRIEAIESLGKIGSPLGMTPLQDILHSSSESQDIHMAAEQALDQIVSQNT
ncbi:hypothetical protein GF339_16650 [candidate division KSB3 bacterium]|uniref:Tetratricopeptide repeat protein n=1 Tax=candidate division KSB3 bacterium TaxID=2044937 RepID=A0A9D5Q6U0_9BACT|nr:hypothetical protein [candidate division KSB3 bacterium]MBD3326219.1 hypothetical protein [candidate division KSB3 bacterium]